MMTLMLIILYCMIGFPSFYVRIIVCMCISIYLLSPTYLSVCQSVYLPACLLNYTFICWWPLRVASISSQLWVMQITGVFKYFMVPFLILLVGAGRDWFLDWILISLLILWGSFIPFSTEAYHLTLPAAMQTISVSSHS